MFCIFSSVVIRSLTHNICTSTWIRRWTLQNLIEKCFSSRRILLCKKKTRKHFNLIFIFQLKNRFSKLNYFEKLIFLPKQPKNCKKSKYIFLHDKHRWDFFKEARLCITTSFPFFRPIKNLKQLKNTFWTIWEIQFIDLKKSVLLEVVIRRRASFKSSSPASGE